ncbi:hypothetical protein AB0I53_19410 [Saccharopolyspora sp. NPDC050389]|uniref:hypothetical protein n=1 Tax=Saccharopolyspora sp. NPDC050389 TaxID=3155516 RepID=UPI0033E97899
MLFPHNDDQVVNYRVTDAVDLNRLVPGAQAYRYTSVTSVGQLDVIVPCCGRISRFSGDFVHAVHLVLCTNCALTYDVGVIDENDGGFVALFTVRGERPVVARRRSDHWLARQYQSC